MVSRIVGKKIAYRHIAVLSGIICTLLVIGLVGTIINYTSILNTKDSTIANQGSTINDLNLQIDALTIQTVAQNDTIKLQNDQLISKDEIIQNLTSQKDQLHIWFDGNITLLNATIRTLENQVVSDNATIIKLQNQIKSLNSAVNELQGKISTYEITIADLQNQVESLNVVVETQKNQVNDLTAIINMSKTNLQTLVFHVCEKTEGPPLDNATDIYNQILALNNNTYDILLLPEYRGHNNWTEEFTWLTEHFGGQDGIPIMLDIFGGGDNPTPTPMLSLENISDAMTTCNVQYLRIAEVISWHIENNQTFRTEYLTSLLNFARTNNVKIFWTEWKAEVYQTLQNYIADYKDIVTVSFSTNSEDLEPADGFLAIHQIFPHWSGSVQPWYWWTHYDEDLLNMPASLLTLHALSAKYIGAEIIQIEPYWYFFENGQSKESLQLLFTMLICPNK